MTDPTEAREALREAAQNLIDFHDGGGFRANHPVERFDALRAALAALPDDGEDYRGDIDETPPIEPGHRAALPADGREGLDELDVERLARALWAWGFDATGPVIRDDVKEPTDGQRRMARKLAAEYAALTDKP